MSIDLNIEVGSEELTAAGSGSVDFANGEFRLDLDVASPVGAFDMRMILAGGTIYEAVPDLGQVEPGKKWVSIDVTAGSHSQAPSIFTSGGNPTGLVDLFTAPEADIIPAGPSQVDDAPTHGYFVSFSVAALQRLRADPRVPPPLRDSLSGGVSNLSGTAQIDQAGRLTEQIVNMTIEGTSAVSLSEALNFSGFGTPARISAPPANLVVPLQQFDHDSGGAGLQVL